MLSRLLDVMGQPRDDGPALPADLPHAPIQRPAWTAAMATHAGAVPEFAEFLVDCGIDSISVSPDSFLTVKQRVGAREAADSNLRQQPQEDHDDRAPH